eukprot:5838722-Prymnesium_polylepis.2
MVAACTELARLVALVLLLTASPREELDELCRRGGRHRVVRSRGREKGALDAVVSQHDQRIANARAGQPRAWSRLQHWRAELCRAGVWVAAWVERPVEREAQLDLCASARGSRHRQ